MNNLLIILISVIISIVVGYAYWLLVLKDRRASKLIKGARERLENKIFNTSEIMNSDPATFFDSTQLLLQFKGSSIKLDNIKARNDSFYQNLGLNIDNILVESNYVSMLMPFNSRYESRYELVRKVCSLNGFCCMRSDQISNTGNLLRQIVEMILKSQLIIALLDGKNPNVFYEIGLAHSIGKPVILIANMQDKNNMPFDISYDRLLLYSSMNDLSSKLSQTLQHIRNA